MEQIGTASAGSGILCRPPGNEGTARQRRIYGFSEGGRSTMTHEFPTTIRGMPAEHTSDPLRVTTLARWPATG